MSYKTINNDDLYLGNDSFKYIIGKSDKKKQIALGINKKTKEVVYIDLNTCPHILIAGATGSGKSVALNTAICSLILANDNTELCYMMIDTKRVELSQYSKLSSSTLILPIAETVKDAEYCLKVAVASMEERYKRMKKAGVKHIDELSKISGVKYQHLVIVIDELADLIYGNKEVIEPLLVKIAMLGRASGIHLIMATQRPTVDVLCGQLKANVDTRLALRVASIRDSINIIDKKGAEQLKGAGDGLLKLPTQFDEIPIQVAYISDINIKRTIASYTGELKL